MHRVHTETLTKQEKRQIWDEIIQDFLTSGQSVRYYSESHELKQDHLNYYLSSFKRKQQHTTPTFIPLEFAATSHHASMEICSDKFRINVPLHVPAAVLETIFTALDKSC